VKKKLKFILPVPIVLIVLAGAYLTILAPKKAVAAPPKVNGTLIELPTDFVVNLADDHYAKISVALLLSTPPPATATVNGVTTLPQDAAVRATITNELTGLSSSTLIDASSRHAVLKTLLAQLKKNTDEPVTQVLFTDLAVQ
jgi:flagellar basal body-associated protein FliL